MDGQEFKKTEVTDSDLLELFDLKEEDLIFNRGNLYDYVIYRYLDRIECALLVYLYRYRNNDVAFQLLFEDSLVILKKNLENKIIPTITHQRKLEFDLFQDFYIMFTEAIQSFKIVKNHSFKVYIDSKIRDMITKKIETEYFIICRSPIGSKIKKENVIFKTDDIQRTEDGGEFSIIEATCSDRIDYEKLVISNINFDLIEKEIYKLIEKNIIKEEWYLMFKETNGLGDAVPQTLKAVSEKFNCSISHVSKKNKIVKNQLSKLLSKIGTIGDNYDYQLKW